MIKQAVTEHPQMPLTRLCELFSVSRSWYYERLSAEQVANSAQKDLDLQDAIECIVLEFPGYGYRRLTAELRRRGWAVNHKRVLRIMRQESLLCQLRRRFVPTTDSGHAFGIYPNLIKDTELDGLDQAWVADIT
jgi:putative transposase